MGKTGGKIRLRRISGSDSEALVSIYESAFGKGSTGRAHKKKVMRLILANRVRQASLAAIEGKTVLGAILVEQFKENWMKGKSSHVKLVMVDGSAQGRGLGTALIKASLAALKTAGFSYVSISARLERCKATALYAKLGFKKSAYTLLKEL